AEGDGSAADQPFVHRVRLRPPALHRRTGLDGLRRVDADVADRVLVAIRQPDVDRVSVDHARDAGGDRALRLRGAIRARAAARKRDHDQNYGNEDGGTQGAAAGPHISMMLRRPELSGGCALVPDPYGIRRTVLSSVSLICPMMS